MKITKISVYQVNLTVKNGGFRQSNGRIWKVLDSSIVRIDTDERVTGWGETTPFGSNYLPAFSEGARAGMGVLAPELLGQDPTDLAAINLLMDETLYGQPYAKTGLDIACWDILGKAAQMPIYKLMGGRLTDEFPIYGSFPIDMSDSMGERIREMNRLGVTFFGFKASGDPYTDAEMIRFAASHMGAESQLIVDTNLGWTVHQALRVSHRTRDIDVIFEQPCATYEECLSFKRATGRTISLDELTLTVQDLIRAYSDGMADMLNLKIGRIGGLTRAKQMRDLAVSLGIPMKVQDTSGSEFNAAATAHIGHSTPPSFVMNIWDCADFVENQTGTGLIRPDHPTASRQHANDEAGLGVTPLFDILGEPIAIYEK